MATSNNTTSKIQSLKIQNFRGIKLFELNTLGKINIFLGRNSVGKTTVLEALFLNTSGSVSSLEWIERLRGLSYKNNSDFLTPFYNLQPDNQPKLEFTIEGETRIVSIKPISGFPRNEEFVASSRQQINGYEMELEIGNEKYTTGKSFNEKDEIFHARSPELVPQKYHAIFNLYRKRNIHSVRALIRAGKKADLIEQLRKIIPALESLEEIDGNFYVTLQGITPLLPMRALGEGLIKIALAFSDMHGVKNNFCLIDEIENGLHYRSQELMWEIICEQSWAENTDCFITSHSYEMMQSLCRFLQQGENEKYRDLIYVHTLIKKTDRLESVSYDFVEFEQEIKDGAEIRGLF